MFWYIVLYVMIFVLLCGYLVRMTPSQNKGRHLTDEHHFAHFSNITRHNAWAHPEVFLMTNPRRLTLKAGSSLFIPRGWWHWIESIEPTVAVNFWTTTTISAAHDDPQCEPFIVEETFQSNDLIHKIHKVIADMALTGQLEVWNSTTEDIDTKQEIHDAINFGNGQARKDNMYVITLPGYKVDKKSSYERTNKMLLEKIRPEIVIPSFLNTTTTDVNLWVSSGYHDTGLHYDDYDGLLTLISGKKRVTLYPPRDTPYLKPLSVVPTWACRPAVAFKYNAYELLGISSSEDVFSSAMLLYQSMRAMGDKGVMQIIKKMLDKNPYLHDNVVWGCKWSHKIQSMRWEMYIYHYNASCSQLKSYMPEGLPPIGHFNSDTLIIHSFDLYKNGVIGSDVHLYHRDASKTQNLEFPFFGYGSFLRVDESNKETHKQHHESLFFMSSYDSVIANFDNFMNNIQVSTPQCRVILQKTLSKYVCNEVAVFNKVEHSNIIIIVLCGIKVDAFAKFLHEFKYPDLLQDHFRDNFDKYTYITHEIGLAINAETLEIERTAFYGLV